MRQTGCGDGDHWGGQRLVGLTAVQPVVTLKANKNSHHGYTLHFKICFLSLCCFSVLSLQLYWTVDYMLLNIACDSRFNHMMSVFLQRVWTDLSLSRKNSNLTVFPAWYKTDLLECPLFINLPHLLLLYLLISYISQKHPAQENTGQSARLLMGAECFSLLKVKQKLTKLPLFLVNL